MIGNCRVGALVSRHGSIDWCCIPRFDSPSFFGALLGGAQCGYFAIAPGDPYDSEQSYVADTNLLETRFRTSSGEGRILDLFAVRDEESKKRSLWPSDEIIRLVEVSTGEISFELEYVPGPHYGAGKYRLREQNSFGIVCVSGRKQMYLRASLPRSALRIAKTAEGKDCVRAGFTLRAGERAEISLSYSDDAPAVIPPLGDALLERIEESRNYWLSWISRCEYHGCFEKEVRRSALALKLLNFAPSGAILAAPTTSLPEEIGGIRNWDYRFCWLRDASFTVRALMELGFYEEAHAHVSWMIHTTRLTQPRLQVLYDVYGLSELHEKNLPWLEGYRGSRPVRIGNDAHGQFQLDVYGEVMEGVARLLPHLDKIDSETRKFLIGIGCTVCKLWQCPDDGIWEVRSDGAQHTHSKVLAWVALDRLVRICRKQGWDAPVDRFEQHAHRIRTEVLSRGFNPAIQSFVRRFGGDETDASLLVLPLVGFCHAGSARMRGTLLRIHQTLCRNGLIYRYRPGDDGLEGREGSFGICNFWMAENLALAGHPEFARVWIESILQHSNSLGLWSEEIDPDTGEFLGNYPQAFTHIGLINSVLTLERVERERRKKREVAA